MACDSDTESATCYSSDDVGVRILLCVSCWNGKVLQSKGEGLLRTMNLFHLV